MPASQIPQQRASFPQGLSEEALKEALQVPCIWVESQDLQDTRCQEVEREVALLSPFIQREVLRSGRGLSQADPVVLPKQVNPDVLSLLLDYCRFHRAPGRSDKERKLFDEKFIRLDTRRLCELTSAADALDMKPLVDLTSRALARMIEGKSAEEIRETFHLPDDLTEEEKLEPVKNATADPRIRLLNRLYAKKRKELAHKKAAELAAEARARKQPHPPSDERPLEDLLSFIGTESAIGKSKSKPRKKRSKKKNGMLQAADSEDPLAAEEARPSSDPLPAGSQDLQDAAGQPSNRSCSVKPHVRSTYKQTSDAGAAPDPHPAQTAASPVGQRPSSRLSHDGSHDWSITQEEVSAPEAPQLAEAKELLQEAQLDQISRNSSEGASESWQHMNGHAPQECSQDSMDRDDAVLLADLHGFASGLGCDWQMQGPDMRSLGTLPLPGVHITTLTSLANFRPSHVNSLHPHSDCHESSNASSEGSEQSELDTDDELEAAYDDRQAANLRESKAAYDKAMSQAESEDDRPNFRPRWPDDPTHASHASFEHWASNGLHCNGTSSTLTSHGSFTFTNACQQQSLTGFGENSLQQHASPLPMSWPQQSEPHMAGSTDEPRIDVGAIQQLFQEFLQRTGLDQHLEIRATGTTNASSLQCKRNVAVQNVLPCGSFVKIQLN